MYRLTHQDHVKLAVLNRIHKAWQELLRAVIVQHRDACNTRPQDPRQLATLNQRRGDLVDLIARIAPAKSAITSGIPEPEWSVSICDMMVDPLRDPLPPSIANPFVSSPVTSLPKARPSVVKREAVAV